MPKAPYVIPSRPEILIALSSLLDSEEPDLDAVVGLLKEDVSLYTVVMSMVNSTVFAGASKFTSLHQAVMRLGLDRLKILTELTVLRRSLSKTGRLDRFWDTATEVAELAAQLAARVSKENPDEAYALGMLHDCGIPLMMENFVDYRTFLQTQEGEEPATLSEQEKLYYGVDHYTVGAEIAEAWHMPQSLCDAIRLQLNYPTALLDTFDEVSDSTKSLFCIVLLAKRTSERYRRFWRINSPREDYYELSPALEFLGLSEVDYLDLREQFLEELEQVK